MRANQPLWVGRRQAVGYEQQGSSFQGATDAFDVGTFPLELRPLGATLGATLGPAGPGPGLSDQAGPHPCSVCARRAGRHRGPPGRRQADRIVGSADRGGKSPGRPRLHRHDRGGQGGARRLHPGHGDDRRSGDHAGAVQRRALRYPARLRADLADQRCGDRAGRQQRVAVQVGRRCDRGGENEARRDRGRLARSGHRQPGRHRVAGPQYRHQIPARAVQGQCACGERHRRRGDSARHAGEFLRRPPAQHRPRPRARRGERGAIAIVS